PSPTLISTLSLHDALPISGTAGYSDEEEGPQRKRYGADRSGTCAYDDRGKPAVEQRLRKGLRSDKGASNDRRYDEVCYVESQIIYRHSKAPEGQDRSEKAKP